MVTGGKPSQEARDAIARSDDLEDHGDSEQALSTLRRAVLRSPDVSVLRARYGRLLHLQQRWEEAIVQFNAALAVVPNAATTLYFRARAKAFLGDRDGAFADYNETLKLQPQSQDALYAMAKIREYQGRFEEALQYLQQLQSISQEQYLDVDDLVDKLEDVLG